MTRPDVIIVASVSCIYNLGSPGDYEEQLLRLEKGQKIVRKELLQSLVDIQYERNDIDFHRGRFRVRGDVVDIFPAYRQSAFRIEQNGYAIIAKALVDKPEEVVVTEIKGQHTTVIELKVAKEDIGKIIGKQGRMAQAIRTILSAASAKKRMRCTFELIE